VHARTVDRFELLHPSRFTALAETVRDDIRHVSPETEVRLGAVPARRSPSARKREDSSWRLR
jgi:sigma54-dependent transcription regulator